MNEAHERDSFPPEQPNTNPEREELTVSLSHLVVAWVISYMIIFMILSQGVHGFQRYAD